MDNYYINANQNENEWFKQMFLRQSLFENYVHVNEIDSTQAFVKDIVHKLDKLEKKEENFLLLTDIQTAGKGRG